ncbi:MAG: prolipoprotein diacylglyceryl transferase family protein [Vicinamibacterales bacterium]
MYPVLFRIGDFEITSFGALVAVAALVGLWLFHRELTRAGLPLNAVDAGVAGVVGGMLGAKLLWLLEHLGEESFAALLLSRGGMSWFGGLAGGVAAGVWMMRRRRLPIIAVLAAATPALAIGHAIGRIGCFLVGDDYGRPSDQPWAVAFPQGLPPTTTPVHPTQLYEALMLVPIAVLLFQWRRQGRRDQIVLARYLIAVGVLRFFIEFLRVNVRVFAGLTVAHLASLCVVAVGIALLVAKATNDSEWRPGGAANSNL